MSASADCGARAVRRVQDVMYWGEPEEVGGVTAKPVIYRFTIDEKWTYVGRFTRASRPLKEYERNVRKLIEGRPYRPLRPDRFRAIHRALFWAHSERRPIKLEKIENVKRDQLNERERHWISKIPKRWCLNGKQTFPLTRVLSKLEHQIKCADSPHSGYYPEQANGEVRPRCPSRLCVALLSQH